MPCLVIVLSEMRERWRSYDNDKKTARNEQELYKKVLSFRPNRRDSAAQTLCNWQQAWRRRCPCFSAPGARGRQGMDPAMDKDENIYNILHLYSCAVVARSMTHRHHQRVLPKPRSHHQAVQFRKPGLDGGHRPLYKLLVTQQRLRGRVISSTAGPVSAGTCKALLEQQTVHAGCT